MTTNDPLLRLQAYADGELPADEIPAMEQMLAEDRRAAALVAELQSVSGALRASDPVRTVPESREFYWSQIRRRLDVPAAAPAGRGFSLGRLWGLLIPVGGIAAAAILLSLPRNDRAPALAEQQPMTLLAGNPAVTFHSDADGMTIHWLQ